MRRLMNIGIAASMAACGMCLYAKTSPANGAATKVEEKSDAAAQFRYAEMLRDGRGEAKNVREAVAWTRKAADGGLAAAQCQMGLFYVNGLGVAVPQSPTSVDVLRQRENATFINNVY